MNGAEVLFVLGCAVGFAVMARHLWLLDREEAQRAKWREDQESLREWEAFKDASRPSFPRVMR